MKNKGLTFNMKNSEHHILIIHIYFGVHIRKRDTCCLRKKFLLCNAYLAMWFIPVNDSLHSSSSTCEGFEDKKLQDLDIICPSSATTQLNKFLK